MSTFLRIRSAVGVALVLGLAACADEPPPPASCTTAADCNVSDGMLTVECCAGQCMAMAPGCDSGYRYITTAPDVGECAVAPMCPARQDMSVPLDMTSHD